MSAADCIFLAAARGWDFGGLCRAACKVAALQELYHARVNDSRVAAPARAVIRLCRKTSGREAEEEGGDLIKK